ncbi:MAG: alkaline phosphatase PhoX [Planctomycetota bacterium]
MFSQPGGWVYVANSEVAAGAGGCGALRFRDGGELVDAYTVLHGTSRNCVGGKTPWSSWLSCEEVPFGLVWECDPRGTRPATVRPALGRFKHEAAIVDPSSGQVYLTEDQPDGCLYRFTPADEAGSAASLESGELAVLATSEGGAVAWRALPDPTSTYVPARRQVTNALRFSSAEGAAIYGGSLYFCTVGDRRIWEYDLERGTLRALCDQAWFAAASLPGLDSLVATPGGLLLAGADSGPLRAVLVDRDRRCVDLLEVEGHSSSELTGFAFDPSGTRLYFSSQRGWSGHAQDGITYEISGPFPGLSQA